MRADAAFAQIFIVLEEVRARGVVPNGTRKALADAVDALRYATAPDNDIRFAGDVSAAIHKFELALCRGDGDKQIAALLRLDELGNLRKVSSNLALAA